MKKQFILFSLLIFLSVNLTYAQKLTKDELVQKANALFEGGKAQESLDLMGEYPEFADEAEILYIKSVAYVDLRDFKNADVAFQKQFDLFIKNAQESREAAEEILTGNPATKENTNLALLMYSTALISYATADLANSLRATAFEKAGVSALKREPKNLAGFDEFRKNYEEISLKTAGLYAQTNQLKDALANYNKAIEINPNNAASYQGRAKVYRKMKKIKLAVADEAKAKRLASQK